MKKAHAECGSRIEPHLISGSPFGAAWPVSRPFCGRNAGRRHVMLNQLTISELAAKLARREVSARAATQACLDRIQRVDGEI